VSHFLIDENVPRSVYEFLEARGHKVSLVKEVLMEGTPDPVVAQIASDQQSIIVTWNIKDFKKERKKFKFGILVFRCNESKAVKRLADSYPLIQFELSRCESAGLTFWAEIQKAGVKIFTPEEL